MEAIIEPEKTNTELKKALVIMNPIAGNGQSLRILPELIQSLTEQGYACLTLTTTKKGSGTEYAVKYAEGCDLLVCSGGDGTANEVIRGMMRLPAEKRPTFGFIPCGSTNDFATTLGIPKTFPKAVSMIMHCSSMIIETAFRRPFPRPFR